MNGAGSGLNNKARELKQEEGVSFKLFNLSHKIMHKHPCIRQMLIGNWVPPLRIAHSSASNGAMIEREPRRPER